MRSLFKSAIFLMIAIMAVLPAFTAPVTLDALDLSQVTICDENGNAIDASANAITEIQDGYSFRVGEVDLRITTENARISLMPGSMLLAISVNEDNPSFMLISGAAEVQAGLLSSPLFVSTPTMAYAVFSESLLGVISTDSEEKAFASGASAMAYSKVSKQRFALKPGFIRDFGSRQASETLTTIEEFRENALMDTCAHIIDFGKLSVQSILHEGKGTLIFPDSMADSAFARFAESSFSELSQYGISLVSIERDRAGFIYPYGMPSEHLAALLSGAYGRYQDSLLSNKVNFSAFLLGTQITGTIAQSKAVISGPPYLPMDSLSDFAAFAAGKAAIGTYVVKFNDPNIEISYASNVPASQVSSFLTDMAEAFNKSRFEALKGKASVSVSVKADVPLRAKGQVEGYDYSLAIASGKALIEFPESFGFEVIRKAAVAALAGASAASIDAEKAIVTYPAGFSNEAARDALVSCINSAASASLAEIKARNLAIEAAKADAEAFEKALSDQHEAQLLSYRRQIAGELSTMSAWQPSSESLKELSAAFSLYGEGMISESTLKAIITGKSALEMTENGAKLKALSQGSGQIILVPDFTRQDVTLSSPAAMRITITGEAHEATVSNEYVTFTYPSSIGENQMRAGLAFAGKAMGTGLIASFPSEGVVSVSSGSAGLQKLYASDSELVTRLENALNSYLGAAFTAYDGINAMVGSGYAVVQFAESKITDSQRQALSEALTRHSELFAGESFDSISSLTAFRLANGVSNEMAASLLKAAIEAEMTVIMPQEAREAASQAAAPAPALDVQAIRSGEVSDPADNMQNTAETLQPAGTEPQAPEQQASEAQTEAASAQKQTTATASKPRMLDMGVDITAYGGYSFGFQAGISVKPFIRYNIFSLRLSLFDNLLYPFDAQGIKDSYVPQGSSPLQITRYAMGYIDEVKLGTQDSVLHLYLGTDETFRFAPDSFIATLDHAFDGLYDHRRMSFLASLNTDAIDLTLFADDLGKYRGDSIWSGFRAAYLPFSGYGFSMAGGAYMRIAELSPFTFDLYPLIDFGFPIVNSNTFKMAFHVTALNGSIVPLKIDQLISKYMLEGRLSMENSTGSFKLDLGGAYNHGKRFSSMINDTKAQSLGGYFDEAVMPDATTLDIIAKAELRLFRHLSITGYLDLPLETSGWRIADSSYAGVNSDVAMLKIDIDYEKWGAGINYSQLGFSTRMMDLYHGLKGTFSLRTALLNLVDSNLSNVSLNAYVNLRPAKVWLELGARRKDGNLLPAGAIGVTLKLDRKISPR